MINVDDEATGGTHFSLVLAGAYKLPFSEAEIYKRDKKNHKEILPVLKPVIEKVASIISRQIEGYNVQGLYLVGGTWLSFRNRGYHRKENKGSLPINRKIPMFVTPLGIAMSCTDQEME